MIIEAKQSILKVSMVLLYGTAIIMGGSAWSLYHEREITHLVVMAISFQIQGAIVHWYLLKRKRN